MSDHKEIEKISYEVDDDFRFDEAVKDVAAKGWKKVLIRGDIESTRTFWLEGTLQGIKVEGYQTTLADREMLERRKLELEQNRNGSFVLQMTAVAVANDYTKRVIPKIQAKLKQVDEKLKFAQHSPAEQSYRKRLVKERTSDESMLARARAEEVRFRSQGSAIIKVKRIIENEISRYTEERKVELSIEREF